MELREKLWNLQTPYFPSKIGGLEVSEFLPKLHLFRNSYKLAYLEPRTKSQKRTQFRSRRVSPSPSHNVGNKGSFIAYRWKTGKRLFRDSVRSSAHSTIRARRKGRTIWHTKLVCKVFVFWSNILSRECIWHLRIVSTSLCYTRRASFDHWPLTPDKRQWPRPGISERSAKWLGADHWLVPRPTNQNRVFCKANWWFRPLPQPPWPITCLPRSSVYDKKWGRKWDFSSHHSRLSSIVELLGMPWNWQILEGFWILRILEFQGLQRDFKKSLKILDSIKLLKSFSNLRFYLKKTTAQLKKKLCWKFVKFGLFCLFLFNGIKLQIF